MSRESGRNRGVMWPLPPGGRAAKPRVPRSERLLQTPVKHSHPDLKQKMSTAPAPTHGLLFGHAPTDEPVEHRFDRRRGDSLASAAALGIVDQAGRLGA